ncbi:MAG: tRNA (adenine-N1)-methyltransferase [Thermoplasmata archaeon]
MNTMHLLLLSENGKKYIVQATGGMQKVSGLGVVDTDFLMKTKIGDVVKLFGEKYIVLQPEPSDYIELIKRKTQIILPKDSGYIITKCGIASGKKICEIGVGVGGLTIFLAFIVGKTGKIFGYEKRKEHIQEAKKNLGVLGLEGIVEFFEQDAEHGIPQRELDAVVCDIPEPWKIMRHIREALRNGSWCACYLPTYNQVERTVLEMQKEEFREIECVELLLRRIVVAENAVRPDFSMLGHTGFLVFGRKIS